MTGIARQFDVRDLHIAQACDLYDIARPAAGYWQKLSHGKTVETQALVNEAFAADEIVTIDSSIEMPQRASPGRITAGGAFRPS